MWWSEEFSTLSQDTAAVKPDGMGFTEVVQQSDKFLPISNLFLTGFLPIWSILMPVDIYKEPC